MVDLSRKFLDDETQSPVEFQFRWPLRLTDAALWTAPQHVEVWSLPGRTVVTWTRDDDGEEKAWSVSYLGVLAFGKPHLVAWEFVDPVSWDLMPDDDEEEELEWGPPPDEDEDDDHDDF